MEVVLILTLLPEKFNSIVLKQIAVFWGKWLADASGTGAQPDGPDSGCITKCAGFIRRTGRGYTHLPVYTKEEDYTGEYTFFSYMPGVRTAERFLHLWHVASRVSR